MSVTSSFLSVFYFAVLAYVNKTDFLRVNGHFIVKETGQHPPNTHTHTLRYGFIQYQNPWRKDCRNRTIAGSVELKVIEQPVSIRAARRLQFGWKIGFREIA